MPFLYGAVVLPGGDAVGKMVLTDDPSVIRPYPGVAVSCGVDDEYIFTAVSGDLETTVPVGIKTPSTHEILAGIYRNGGINGLKNADGAFTGVICDKSIGRFLLIRDVPGSRMLFYTICGNVLFFAEKLSLLLEISGSPGQIDINAVSDYLSLGVVPGDKSIYSNIKKVPPAGAVVCDSNGVSVIRYREFPTEINEKISLGEAAGVIRRKVFDSVQKKLNSGDAAGLLLSGGLDSAVVGAVCNRLTESSINIFTAGFREKDYDESETAFKTASFFTGGRIKARHHLINITPEILDEVPRFMRMCDEPFGNASLLATAALTEAAGRECSSVFTGDGADELFGGYERYLALRYAVMFKKLPHWMTAAVRLCPPGRERGFCGRLRRFFAGLDDTEMRIYFNWLDRAEPEIKKHLLGREILPETFSRFEKFLPDLKCRTWHEAACRLDWYTYLPDDSLAKSRYSYQISNVSMFSPFVNAWMMDYAARLPWKHKQRCGSRKRVLSTAFADILPPGLAKMKKRGFGVPIADWLMQPGTAARFREEFRQGALADSGIVDMDFAAVLLDDHIKHKNDNSYILYNLFALSCFLGR